MEEDLEEEFGTRYLGILSQGKAEHFIPQLSRPQK